MSGEAKRLCYHKKRGISYTTGSYDGHSIPGGNISKLIEDFFDGEWLEFPTNLVPSDMECDPGLIPKVVVLLRLPHSQERYEKLQEVWGYKGFPL